MHRFSKRHLLIFVACLLLGAALIGLGIANVIQFKQRVLPSRQTDAVTGRDSIRLSLSGEPHSGILGKARTSTLG